jgi:hypothetical protein
MQKWEYLILRGSYYNEHIYVYLNSVNVLSDVNEIDFLKYLNKLGNDGWEMVNYHEEEEHPMWSYHFKRPLE